MSAHLGSAFIQILFMTGKPDTSTNSDPISIFCFFHYYSAFCRTTTSWGNFCQFLWKSVRLLRKCFCPWTEEPHPPAGPSWQQVGGAPCSAPLPVLSSFTNWKQHPWGDQSTAVPQCPTTMLQGRVTDGSHQSPPPHSKIYHYDTPVMQTPHHCLLPCSEPQEVKMWT